MFCRFCCRGGSPRSWSRCTGPQSCTPLAQLTEHPTFRELDIAEINTLGSMGPMHALLQQLPRLPFRTTRVPSGWDN